MAGNSTITSSGVLVHPGNPLKFAFPLFVIQLWIILGLTRLLGFFLSPMRQPRVVAEIIGGVLLGPTAFGRIPGFTETFFNHDSLYLLESFSVVGLVFFLFLVGLELDPESLKTAGKTTAAISAAGIVVPFAMGVGMAKFLYEDVDLMGDLTVKPDFGPFLVFMGVSVSITAFPVLARILAEFKLLTTDVGGLAMAAAAVGDVVAWIFLALAVALTNAGTPLVCVWDLLLGCLFVILTFVLVKPFMAKLALECPEDGPIPEPIVVTTFMLCLAAAFLTDLCGIHAIFGAFLFGLIFPKEGHFATAMIEKVEDFTSTLLLPLYFVSSGLKTRVDSIDSARMFGLLVLVVAVSTVGKVGAVYATSRLAKIPPKKSLIFGILMNTKGLVELIVLNIGVQKGVIGPRLFTIMVLMAIITTFMTSPIVSLLLPSPTGSSAEYSRRKIEASSDGDLEDVDLRLFMCAHGIRNVPGLVHLCELSKGRRKKALRVYLLHLIEYSERSSAIKMVAKARKEGKPFVNKNIDGVDNVGTMFQTYGRLAKIVVRPMIAIASTSSMHEEICNTAAEKRANMIILPFHKHSGFDGLLDVAHPGFHNVNLNVIRNSPCSVGILVDRGLGGSSNIPSSEAIYRILILFFGGQDDRECLSLGRRMMEHPNVILRVVRFTEKTPGKETSVQVGDSSSDHHHGHRFHWTGSSHNSHERRAAKAAAAAAIDPAEVRRKVEEERRKDEAAMVAVRAAADRIAKESPSQFGEAHLSCEQIETDDVLRSVAQVASEININLVITGAARHPAPILAHLPIQENANKVDAHELGVIGDALTARDLSMTASVLVVQQHDPDLIVTRIGLSSRLFKRTPSHPELRKLDTHPEVSPAAARTDSAGKNDGAGRSTTGGKSL